MHQRIVAGVERQGGLSEKLFKKSRHARHQALRTRFGMVCSSMEKIQDRILEKLVRGKVADRFGGRLKAFVSGGAPLNYDIGVFFLALGVRLLQGYGQTETAPVVSANLPHKIKIDTVGPAFPGVDVKIAGDGEILVRGELTMQGYWNAPELTAEALRRLAGCIPAISASWTKTATSGSPIARKTSSSTPAVTMFRPSGSKAHWSSSRRSHRPWSMATNARIWSPFWSPTKASWRTGPARTAAMPGLQSFRIPSVSTNACVRHSIAPMRGSHPSSRCAGSSIAAEGFTTDNGLMTPSLKIRRHEIRKIYGERLEALYGRKRV